MWLTQMLSVLSAAVTYDDIAPGPAGITRFCHIKVRLLRQQATCFFFLPSLMCNVEDAEEDALFLNEFIFLRPYFFQNQLRGRSIMYICRVFQFVSTVHRSDGFGSVDYLFVAAKPATLVEADLS